MRIIAIILNFAFIGVLVIAKAVDMLTGKSEPKDWIPMILGLTFLIINLLGLFGAKGNNLLSIYFKRKVLEEEKKIEELSKGKS